MKGFEFEFGVAVACSRYTLDDVSNSGRKFESGTVVYSSEVIWLSVVHLVKLLYLLV